MHESLGQSGARRREKGLGVIGLAVARAFSGSLEPWKARKPSVAAEWCVRGVEYPQSGKMQEVGSFHLTLINSPLK